MKKTFLKDSELKAALVAMRNSLSREIDVGSLFSRNEVAHKWKAPWRALLLRESVAWRLIDLLDQSVHLQAEGKHLGARILVRAAFETLAVLVHVNQSMQGVVRGQVDFHHFSEHVTRLLLGSRNKSTPVESVHISKILGKANQRYQGLLSWYEDLSETAHPNYGGMLQAYSTADAKEYVTRFRSRWAELTGSSNLLAAEACLAVFETEYNEIFTLTFEELEEWIVSHDARLEATKNVEKPKRKA
jgi:hypothetical protein